MLSILYHTKTCVASDCFRTPPKSPRTNERGAMHSVAPELDVRIVHDSIITTCTCRFPTFPNLSSKRSKFTTRTRTRTYIHIYMYMYSGGQTSQGVGILTETYICKGADSTYIYMQHTGCPCGHHISYARIKRERRCQQHPCLPRDPM